MSKYEITVTAVCPGWVDTDLLKNECNGKKVRFPEIAKPKLVAQNAIQFARNMIVIKI